MNSMNDETQTAIQQFNQVVEKNELLKELIDPRSKKSFDELKDLAKLEGALGKVVNDISKTGEVKPYEWKSIKTLILFFMR